MNYYDLESHSILFCQTLGSFAPTHLKIFTNHFLSIFKQDRYRPFDRPDSP